MNILLVNDDGYKAEGINALDKVFSSRGHFVSVVSPRVEQSGKSHSLSILGSVNVIEYKPNHFSLTGSPADCVIYGLYSGFLKKEPDLIISGINHGYNISTDIIYSGTCGAARQAALYGYKAIAISEGTYMQKASEGVVENLNEGFDFERTATFLADNLDIFLSHLDSKAFLNINVPHSFDGTWELAQIGEIKYHDKFRFEKKNDGSVDIINTQVQIEYKKRESEYLNDFEVVSLGKASVSYVNLIPTISHPHMAKMSK